MVSGDTGPLHIAAAVGTPIVGALRADESASATARGRPADVCRVAVRVAACAIIERRCRRAGCLLDEIAVAEVLDAVDAAARLTACRA